MSLLENEYDVRSILHGQMSLALVNQICVVHEAMNSCKNQKIHKRLASKMKILFDIFQKWLKVGGKLFISDYCCSDTEHTDHFKAYVKQRGYNLMSPAAYGRVGRLKNS